MQQPLVSLTINVVLLDSSIYSNRVGIAGEMRDAYVLFCEVCTLIVVLTEYIMQ